MTKAKERTKDMIFAMLVMTLSIVKINRTTPAARNSRLIPDWANGPGIY
jgi:hypothetical protein